MLGDYLCISLSWDYFSAIHTTDACDNPGDVTFNVILPFLPLLRTTATTRPFPTISKEIFLQWYSALYALNSIQRLEIYYLLIFSKLITPNLTSESFVFFNKKYKEVSCTKY